MSTFEIQLIAIVAGWAAWSTVNGMIAHEKRRDVSTVVIMSLLLSPLLVYLYLVAVPAKPPEPEEPAEARAPKKSLADEID